MIAHLSLTNVKIFYRLLFRFYIVLQYVTGVKKTTIEFLGMVLYKRIIDLCHLLILTDLIPVVCVLK